MLPTLIGLVAFLLLVLIIGVLFGALIITLLVNGVILYLVGLRSLKELNRGWLKEYGIGAIAALLLVLLLHVRVPLLWDVTTWLALCFIIAQVVHYVKK